MGSEGAGPLRCARQGGGVKLCSSDHELVEAADSMLGRTLVTHQDAARRENWSAALCRGGHGYRSEFISASCLDRKSERIMIVACVFGRHGDRGESPRPSRTRSSADRRSRCRHAGLPGPRDRIRARHRQCPDRPRNADPAGCYRAFVDYDASIAGDQSAGRDPSGDLVALDAK